MHLYSYKQLIYCILTSKKHLNQQKNIPRVFHNNSKSFLQWSYVALQKISNWCIINPTNHYDWNADYDRTCQICSFFRVPTAVFNKNCTCIFTAKITNSVMLLIKLWNTYISLGILIGLNLWFKKRLAISTYCSGFSNTGSRKKNNKKNQLVKYIFTWNI